jgi:hypothetical protein
LTARSIDGSFATARPVRYFAHTTGGGVLGWIVLLTVP